MILHSGTQLMRWLLLLLVMMMRPDNVSDIRSILIALIKYAGYRDFEMN